MSYKITKLMVGMITFVFGYFLIELGGKSFGESKLSGIFVDRLVSVLVMGMGWVLLITGTFVTISMIILIYCNANNFPELFSSSIQNTKETSKTKGGKKHD